MTCPYCEHRKAHRNKRGLCDVCYVSLRAAGRLDALYPPKCPPRGASPLEWHGRKG